MSANEKKPPWKREVQGGVHRRNFSREVRGREKRGTTPDGDVRTEMKRDASLEKKMEEKDEEKAKKGKKNIPKLLLKREKKILRRVYA